MQQYKKGLADMNPSGFSIGPFNPAKIGPFHPAQNGLFHPALTKCIRPLWWHASAELKEAGTDDAKIQKHLDAIEYEQTREIDFSRHMQNE